MDARERETDLEINKYTTENVITMVMRFFWKQALMVEEDEQLLGNLLVYIDFRDLSEDDQNC